jgi:TfoX/Sxy family transcriptional regulator of competence genes
MTHSALGALRLSNSPSCARAAHRRLNMAFDAGLAQRIREILSERDGVTERRMFGGLAFMLNGHMFVGVLGTTLMVRVGPDRYQEALELAHVREMDFTGRPMKGYVFVDEQGISEDDQLDAWIAWSTGFVASLPDKLAR